MGLSFDFGIRVASDAAAVEVIESIGVPAGRLDIS
jgi:hypothetical protein